MEATSRGIMETLASGLVRFLRKDTAMQIWPFLTTK